MLNREELAWLKKSANELNNSLQEISASVYRIENISEPVSEIRQYLAIMVQSVDRATRVTGSILKRVRDSETVFDKIVVGESSRTKTAGYPARSIEEFEERLEGVDAADADVFTVVDAKGPVEAAQELGLDVANPNGSKELIMMVDDESAVLTLAKMMLTDAGYKVIAVTEPAKALELFKRIHSHIGLVILDFAMPVMDGGELYDSLLVIDPRVAVVLSSGYADQTKLSQMLSKGLKGFIPKPYTPDRLLMQIRSVLDINKRRRSL